MSWQTGAGWQGVAVVPGELTIGGDVTLSNASLTFNNGIGTTKTSNGTFTGNATGWTLAAGWTYNANAVDKDGDGTGTLSQSVSAVANEIYLVSFVITNWTVGTVTAAVGGVSGTARGANGTFREYIKATGTGNLTFTPTNTARFTIDTVTVQKVGEAPADSAALWVDDQGGTAGKASLYVRGENGTVVALSGDGLSFGADDADVTLAYAANKLTLAGGQFILPAGTTALPSLAWPNMGLSQSSTNTSSLVFNAAADGAMVMLSANIIGIGLQSDGTYWWSNSATTADVSSGAQDTGLSRIAAGVVGVGTGTQGSAAGTLAHNASILGGTATGAVTTSYRLIKKVTGIADNTATDVFTVTVPNANHAAAIRVTFLSSNGSTDAFESSRTAEGSVVLARTTGVATVTAVATLELAQIATVSGGATHTLAYGVSAISGAAGATQTFTIQVTIDDSGNTGSNQVVAVAELVNSEATGVTIS